MFIFARFARLVRLEVSGDACYGVEVSQDGLDVEDCGRDR